MWRYVTGAVAAAALAGAGIYWWAGSGNASPGAVARTAAASPARAGDDVPAPLSAEPASRDGRRFARYDADRNGRVSRAEYLANRTKAFARLDADRDGRLTFDEWSQRTTEKFARADNDRDGALDAGEFAATRPMRRARGRTDCPPPRDEDQG